METISTQTTQTPFTIVPKDLPELPTYEVKFDVYDMGHITEYFIPLYSATSTNSVFKHFTAAGGDELNSKLLNTTHTDWLDRGYAVHKVQCELAADTDFALLNPCIVMTVTPHEEDEFGYAHPVMSKVRLTSFMSV